MCDDSVQMKMPVTAGASGPAKFQKTMESDSDEELDSEDLDESDGLLMSRSICQPVHGSASVLEKLIRFNSSIFMDLESL